MTKLLLSIHVLAAIIAIGPVTVAASMFPAATRRALADPRGAADPRDVAVLRNLHRICRVYAALGVLVPVFGLATASSLGVLGDPWLIISMVLTVAAAVVLAFLILPGQTTVLAGLDAAGQPATRSDAIDRWSPTTTAEVDGGPGRAAVVTDLTGSPDGATPGKRVATRLGMVTGIFNLLWAIVVVLMIVRPGSTTGV